MAKKRKIISENQIKRELSKINIELNKINIKKPEIKEVISEKSDILDQEFGEEEQFEDFHENLETGRASGRFTAPILLPSGQESIDNLEDFAAVLPSPDKGDEKDISYAGNKKNYTESSEGGNYSGKSDYSLDSKYSASQDSLSSAGSSDRINTPLIREDFRRGRMMNEVQAAGSIQAKTDWEDKSRLEEFARQQAEYHVSQERESSLRKRRV